MAFEITLDGKTYPVRMRMTAACRYEEKTGRSLTALDENPAIFGNGRDIPLNAGRFVAFVHSIMEDGCYPAKLELTTEDVANLIPFRDDELTAQLARVYIMERFHMDEIAYAKLLEATAQKKTEIQNQTSPG